MRSFFAIVAVAAFLGTMTAGCLEFDLDAQPYICIKPDDCGEGYSCLRGEQCYCMCMPLGSEANSSCQDPTCQKVDTID